MSGGSHGYLYSRAEDECRSLATQIQHMGDRLDETGFPMVAARTHAVAAKLLLAAAEAHAMKDLWQCQEWNDSGDWGRAQIRKEAVRLGEKLPECQHEKMNPRCWSLGDDGKPAYFDICDECDWRRPSS